MGKTLSRSQRALFHCLLWIPISEHKKDKILRQRFQHFLLLFFFLSGRWNLLIPPHSALAQVSHGMRAGKPFHLTNGLSITVIYSMEFFVSFFLDAFYSKTVNQFKETDWVNCLLHIFQIKILWRQWERFIEISCKQADKTTLWLIFKLNLYFNIILLWKSNIYSLRRILKNRKVNLNLKITLCKTLQPRLIVIKFW